MSRYFFSSRWPDHEEADRLGTVLPNETAALSHAICEIKLLIRGGKHNDPRLMMIVRNETLKTVLYLPFLPACA